MKLLGSVRVVRAIFPHKRVVNRNQGYDQLTSLSHIATAKDFCSSHSMVGTTSERAST